MGELDSRGRPLCFYELSDSRQRLNVLVLPKSQVARRNTPLGSDAVASTTTKPTPAWGPEMDQVKVLANKSSAEYMHIGDIAIRFGESGSEALSG
jgi:hypothetical protein